MLLRGPRRLSVETTKFAPPRYTSNLCFHERIVPMQIAFYLATFEANIMRQGGGEG